MAFKVSEEIVQRSYTDFTIIGKIETLDDGDKIAKNFTGQILGFYRAKYDCTTDFIGTILTRGDSLIALIYKEDAKNNRF